MLDAVISGQIPRVIKVMTADDHPLVRQALRAILQGQTDIELVGEVSDGEEAIKLSSQLMPDVIVMDISMPKVNGIEATRRIKAQYPEIRILALTVHNDMEHILGLLEAGAAGYLIKTALGEEVLTAIRSVMAGESVVSAEVMKEILKTTNICPGKSVNLKTGEKLNPRDLEILRMIAKGMSNKDISQKLGLSAQTIRCYIVNIFSKLSVGSRTEAVMVGLRSGILSLKDLE